jgi:hypothetical protein
VPRARRTPREEGQLATCMQSSGPREVDGHERRLLQEREGEKERGFTHEEAEEEEKTRS